MLTASALSVISKPTTPFMLCSEQAACHSICPVLSPFGCFQQCLRPINKEQGIPVMLRALWLPFLPERLITRTNIFNSRLPPPCYQHTKGCKQEKPKRNTLHFCITILSKAFLGGMTHHSDFIHTERLSLVLFQRGQAGHIQSRGFPHPKLCPGEVLSQMFRGSFCLR